MEGQNRIAELETEISRLKAEIEKAQEQAQELEKSRSAMLLMLEDLNVSTAQVEKAKNEWEATFDSISDPLFIHDKEFKIVRANKTYAEAAGMTFNHFIGRPYYEVFPKMEKPFKMCLKASELQEEFSCPVTNRIFNVRFYPIKDIDNKLLSSIHIMEDTTEKKRAEKKLKDEIEITTHLLMIADATAHTTDMDKLMQQVVHCGHEIMKCDVCLSYLWNEEDKVFQPSQCYGLSHEIMPLFRIEPLDKKTEFVKKAMEGKETVIIIEGERLRSLEDRRKNSTSQPHNFSTSALTWLPDINALIAIPLASKIDYLGLIVGIYTNPPPLTKSPSFPPLKKGDEGGLKGGKGGFVFTERDKKIMQGIMHQVSIALEQARLYKDSVVRGMELSHKIETIQVMHEIDRSILSTLDPNEILETVVRTIPRVIACDRATIATVDKNRKGFVYKAGFGTSIIVKGAFVPFRETTATEIIETGRPQYVPYLSEVKDLPSLERHLVKEGFMSHIRVPLMVKGEAIGVLSIGAKRPAAFTPDDLSLLEKIASQIGIAMENSRLLTDLDELFIGTVRALSSSIDAKSRWTAGHSERVTQYALKIAKEMGMDDMALSEIELTGLLHDIGKIGTYEAILDKPGKLTEEELKLIQQHPSRGAEILSPIKQLQDIIPCVKYHHEFYNGTGYPEGLKGEAIPIYARILAVADSVDAMGADRPYRKGKPMEDIIAELKRCAGTQFDPKVVDGFLKTAGDGQ